MEARVEHLRERHALINREGYPFIIIPLLVCVVFTLAARYVGQWAFVYAGLAFVVGCYMTFFFRDPDRETVCTNRDLLSSADGVVHDICEVEEPEFMKTRVRRISIYLNLLDVHINRTPIWGKVAYLDYHEGRFLPSYRKDASELNEHTSIGIENRYGKFFFKQIVGILARRVNHWLTVGQEVRTGERVGLMKFGSRLDIFVPLDAEVAVRVGQRVVGGVTIVAQLPKEKKE